jgi:hypothetical protein
VLIRVNISLIGSHIIRGPKSINISSYFLVLPLWIIKNELYTAELRTSGFFFWGWLLRFAAVCGEPYNRGGRIWSLANRTNRAFRSKFTTSASKLQQTAHFIISLQQTAYPAISPQQTAYFTVNCIFYNKPYIS